LFGLIYLVLAFNGVALVGFGWLLWPLVGFYGCMLGLSWKEFNSLTCLGDWVCTLKP